jgi:hypothetical protein
LRRCGLFVAALLLSAVETYRQCAKNEQGVMPNEFACVRLLTKFEPHEAIAN